MLRWIVRATNRVRRREMAAAIVAAISVAFPQIVGSEDSSLLGLPPVAFPANNPQASQKIALGQKLFEDKRFSFDGSVSCANCHEPARGFADGRAVAKGVREQSGTRNTPSLVNVSYYTSQFWDGRRASLEEQAAEPFINPSEHGLTAHDEVLQVVRSDNAYVEAFRSAYAIPPSSIRMEHVVQALANFERTLVAGNSPFDRYYYKGDKSALTDSAQRGYVLFRDRARCDSCHTIGQQSALFTDNQFHALGIGYETIAPKLGALAKKLANASRRETEALIISEPDISVLGRFVVTLKPNDIGRFRTPTLRNVALTAPYMHDGSVATLEEVIELELYNRGTLDSRASILSVQDKKDLAEFLRSLTSAHLPRLP